MLQFNGYFLKNDANLIVGKRGDILGTSMTASRSVTGKNPGMYRANYSYTPACWGVTPLIFK
jgi:hypothetical protein